MKPLTEEEITKFAGVSQKFRNLLLKVAQNESTEFNEAPPVNDDEEEKNGEKPKKKEAGPPESAQAPAEAAAQPPAPAEAAPMDTPEAIGARAAQSFIGPEIIQAAVSGDPVAADIIARTAGAIAASVTEKASISMNGGASAEEISPEGIPGEAPISAEGAPSGIVAVPAGPEGAPPAAAPPGPSTPEGVVADQIIPEQNATPPQPPAEGLPPEGGSKAVNTKVAPQPAGQPVPANGAGENQMYDAQTVAKMIQLAKAGKI